MVVPVGALTLLIGCIIGCAKDDIKRVLAWSTVCQIGYMFLAVGLGGGAYALAIIHLLAHGFFKAGLFLGAGSVMHGMNDQADIRRFGGLWGYMPITWVTFGSASSPSSASRRSSGFFTKEPIIEAAFDGKDEGAEAVLERELGEPLGLQAGIDVEQPADLPPGRGRPRRRRRRCARCSSPSRRLSR